MEGRNLIITFFIFALSVNLAYSTSSVTTSFLQDSYNIANNNNFFVPFLSDVETIRFNISQNTSQVIGITLNVSSYDGIGDTISISDLEAIPVSNENGNYIYESYLLFNQNYIGKINNHTLSLITYHNDKYTIKATINFEDNNNQQIGPLYFYIDNTPPNIYSSIPNETILLNYTLWNLSAIEDNSTIQDIDIDSIQYLSIDKTKIDNKTFNLSTNLDSKSIHISDRFVNYVIKVKLNNKTYNTTYILNIDLNNPEISLIPYKDNHNLYYLNNTPYFDTSKAYAEFNNSEEIKNCSYILDGNYFNMQNCSNLNLTEMSQENHTIIFSITDMANKTSTFLFNLINNNKRLDCTNIHYCTYKQNITSYLLKRLWNMTTNLSQDSKSNIIYKLNITTTNTSKYNIQAIELPSNISQILSTSEEDNQNISCLLEKNIFYCIDKSKPPISNIITLNKTYSFTDNTTHRIFETIISQKKQDTSKTSYVDGNIYLTQIYTIENTLNNQTLYNISWNISDIIDKSYTYNTMSGIINNMSGTKNIILELNKSNAVITKNYNWILDPVQYIDEYTYLYYNATIENKENTDFSNINLSFKNITDFTNNGWENTIGSSTLIDIPSNTTQTSKIKVLRKKLSNKTIREYTSESNDYTIKNYNVSIDIDTLLYDLKFKLKLPKSLLYKWDSKENLKTTLDANSVTYETSGDYIIFNLGKLNSSKHYLNISYKVRKSTEQTKEDKTTTTTETITQTNTNNKETETVKPKPKQTQQTHQPKTESTKNNKESKKIVQKIPLDLNKNNFVIKEISIQNPFETLKNITFEISKDNALNIQILNTNEYPPNKVIFKNGLITLKLNISITNPSNNISLNFSIKVKGMTKDKMMKEIISHYSIELTQKTENKSNSKITGFFTKMYTGLTNIYFLLSVATLSFLYLLKYMLSQKNKKTKYKSTDAIIVKKFFKR